VVLALAASCGGGSRTIEPAVLHYGSNLFENYGLPDESHVLRGSASLVTNTKELLTRWVDRDLDLVIVAVELSNRTTDYSAEIGETLLNPVLFLEDGTPLKPVFLSSLRDRVSSKKAVAAIEEAHFRKGFLQTEEELATGLLFFQLPETAKRSEDVVILRDGQGMGSQVDLRRSLLSLSYEYKRKDLSAQSQRRALCLQVN
jgi:hypothetical protein